MLRESFQRLSRDTLIYSIGNVSQIALSFLLVPIFTRVFSPSDYGALDTITTAVSIITIILMFGMNSAAQRYFFDSKDVSHQNQVISTGFWFLLVIGGISALLAVSSSRSISFISFGTEQFTTSFTLAFATVPIALIISFLKDALRLQFSSWKFVAVSLLDFITRTLFAIYFVVSLRQGVEGNFLGALLSSIITAVVLCWIYRNTIRRVFKYTLFRGMFRYGFPLVFAGLAYWVISLSDRFFIARYVGLTELGIYSIGNKISSVIMVFYTALGLAWAPFILSRHAITDVRPIIDRALIWTLTIFSLLAIGITGLSREILSIMAPPEYQSAAQVVGLLTFGLVFLSLSSIFATGISLTRKTEFLTYAASISGAVNIMLNFLLIPRYGIIGAAWSTLVSYLVISLLQYYFSHRLFPVMYERTKLVLIVALAGLFIWCNSELVFDNRWFSTGLKILITLSFVPILEKLHLLPKPELVAVLNEIRQLFRRHNNKSTGNI